MAAARSSARRASMAAVRSSRRPAEKGQPRGAQLRDDEHRGLALDSGSGGGGWGPAA